MKKDDGDIGLGEGAHSNAGSRRSGPSPFVSTSDYRPSSVVTTKPIFGGFSSRKPEVDLRGTGYPDLSSDHGRSSSSPFVSTSVYKPSNVVENNPGFGGFSSHQAGDNLSRTKYTALSSDHGRSSSSPFVSGSFFERSGWGQAPPDNKADRFFPVVNYPPQPGSKRTDTRPGRNSHSPFVSENSGRTASGNGRESKKIDSGRGSLTSVELLGSCVLPSIPAAFTGACLTEPSYDLALTDRAHNSTCSGPGSHSLFVNFGNLGRSDQSITLPACMTDSSVASTDKLQRTGLMYSTADSRPSSHSPLVSEAPGEPAGKTKYQNQDHRSRTGQRNSAERHIRHPATITSPDFSKSSLHRTKDTFQAPLRNSGRPRAAMTRRWQCVDGDHDGTTFGQGTRYGENDSQLSLDSADDGCSSSGASKPPVSMEDFLEKDKGSNDQTGSRRTSIGSRGSSHSPSLDKAELFSFAPGNSLHTPESRHTITGSDRISHSQSGDSTAGEDKKLPQVDEFIASLHKIGK